MKVSTLYLILILATSYVAKSQTIIPLYESVKDTQEAYYKDTFNDLDLYVGTWKYTNGDTSLTITLQKKLLQEYFDRNITYYEDVIIGEYKYIENGQEKINTLAQLQANLLDHYDYNIAGNIIIGPDSVLCYGCALLDRKLLLQFIQPNREIPGFEPQMIFQRADSGGMQKLKLVFRTISGSYEEEGVTPQYTSYSIPFGEYLLEKQP